MSDELTAPQAKEAEAGESAGSDSRSEQAQAQPGEQTTVAQDLQREADSSESGTQDSILDREKGEEPGAEKVEEKKDKRSESPRAPEEYADFTVSEGMKLEGPDLTEFKSFAKEQDLTQEQAQKVLDFAGPKIKAMIEQPLRAWNEMQVKWQEEVKADPEIGGTKFGQSIKEAGNVFVPGEANPFVKSEAEAKALRDALNTTGAGNNPAIVKLFVKMGRVLAEPGHLTGKPAVQNKQEAILSSMYPMMGDGPG